MAFSIIAVSSMRASVVGRKEPVAVIVFTFNASLHPTIAVYQSCLCSVQNGNGIRVIDNN